MARDEDDLEDDEDDEEEDDQDDDEGGVRAAPAIVQPDPSWSAAGAPAPAGKSRPWWKTVPETSAPRAVPTAGNDLADGETASVKGSAAQPYVLKNTGGVYSCSCPAWRNQSTAIERRTCKHLRVLRGDAAEDARVGTTTTVVRARSSSSASSDAGPPLLLAHTWEHDVDLTGWWMSEKLDGVRAYWDGRAFVSRLGNQYHAPDWFTAGFPDTPLDGELWGGRKKFQRTVSVVRRQDKGEAWKEITFVVFDAPAMDAPFEDRLAFVQQHLGERKPAYARHHPHEPCRGLDHLREELARVESLGGEGLMMRRPQSRYEVGRSSTLLKVKSFHDAEARVVGHVPGAGRHKGRLGALLCEMPDGTRFSVGTGFSDAERGSPPDVGSIVTYRYQELSEGGVPRFPSYVGVRHDVAWPPPAPPRRQSGETATRAAPAPAAPAPPPAPSGAIRRFERRAGDMRDLWEIELAGRSHTVRLTRAGEVVETRTSQLASVAAAWRDADRLVGERLAEGFVELE